MWLTTTLWIILIYIQSSDFAWHHSAFGNLKYDVRKHHYAVKLPPHNKDQGSKQIHVCCWKHVRGDNDAVNTLQEKSLVTTSIRRMSLNLKTVKCSRCACMEDLVLSSLYDVDDLIKSTRIRYLASAWVVLVEKLRLTSIWRNNESCHMATKARRVWSWSKVAARGYLAIER